MSEEEIYITLELDLNVDIYYADIYSDGEIASLTLEEAKERKKNIEADPHFDKDNYEVHIFKLVRA